MTDRSADPREKQADRLTKAWAVFGPGLVGELRAEFGRRANAAVDEAWSNLGLWIAQGKTLVADEKLRSYMRTTCRNILFDRERKNYRVKNATVVFESEIGDPLARLLKTADHRETVDANAGESAKEMRRRRRWLLNHLGLLSPDERKCVRLTIRNRDVKSIAKHTNKAVATVRVLLRRAREKLRKAS